MPRPHQRHLPAIVLAALVLACGAPKGDTASTGSSSSSSGAGSSGDTGEPTPWDLFAEAECAAYAACGCPAPKGLAADLAACIATRKEALAAAALAAAQAGAAWDPACASARLAAIASRCDDAVRECAGEQCSLFVGVGEAGSPCTAGGDWSECAAPNGCFGGACMPYCSASCGDVFCPPGTACICDYIGTCGCGTGGGVGARCPVEYGQLCAPGLVCADEVCVEPGAVGEPCNADACVAGAYCTADLICAAQKPGGEPCQGPHECATWSCVDNLCAGPGDEGEPCAFPQQSCKAGLTCINGDGGVGGVCVVLRPPGGACTHFYECEGLAYCQGGTCVPTICEGL